MPKLKNCVDCNAVLRGHGMTVARCRPCAARARYIERFGKPPDILIAKCEVCSKEFQDYASNHKKTTHGVYFCSVECRAAWTGVHNSVSRGGDGVKRTKAEKDKINYRKTSDRCRELANVRYRLKRTEILAGLRTKNRALKEEVIAAYGGRCACCGETHIEFLTIDHMNGDGAAHRARTGKGRKIYQDLKEQGFPKDGYQLLCFNCNIALGFYGYCPHRPDVRREMKKAPRDPGRRRTVC